jgi:alkylhydroperoxidase family enzyme
MDAIAGAKARGWRPRWIGTSASASIVLAPAGPREKAAIHYAEVLAGDLDGADDALFDELRVQFTEEEIVDLGIRIVTFVGYGRLIRVLGLEIGGVCPMPPPRSH